MRLRSAGLLIVLLCGILGADAPRAGGPRGARQRERLGRPASQPATATQPADEAPAMRPPGWRRDWWPRRDGRGREVTPGTGERLRFNQGPGGPPWQDNGEQLSPDQEARLMDFARKNFPQLYQRLVMVRNNSPMLFQQMLRRTRGPISEIMRVQERDPAAAERLIEAHRVEIELTDLRGQYRAAASSEQREQIKSKMRELLIKRSELRLERLKDEVRNLQKRLDQARNEMARRENNKDQIVAQELKKLLAGGSASPGAGRLPSPPGQGPRAGRRAQQRGTSPSSDAPAPLE